MLLLGRLVVWAMLQRWSSLVVVFANPHLSVQRCPIPKAKGSALINEKIKDITTSIASIGCLGALIIFVMIVLVGLFLILRFLMGMC